MSTKTIDIMGIFSEKIVKVRICWFCEKKCLDYVSICDMCKTEKFKFKNKNLHYTDRTKSRTINPSCI